MTLHSATITAVTIAQNEAANLPAALASVTRASLRHLVIDGGSTDSTGQIAKDAGAEVRFRAFDDTASQYNWALTLVDTPWVFFLDADEEIDDELAEELRSFGGSARINAFACRRRNLFVSTWLKGGAWYPDYNLRLLRVGSAHYETRQVHSRVVFEGSSGRLGGHILHRTHKDVSSYISKLNDYTAREVGARNQSTEAGVEAKAQLRRWWFKTPFRPLSRFVIDYVVRRGYRDGRTGFDLAVLAAFYEFVVGVRQRHPDRTPDVR